MNRLIEGEKIQSPTRPDSFARRPSDLWVPRDLVSPNGSRTRSGLRLPEGVISHENGAKEREGFKTPSHEIVLITDFSSAKGARNDNRSPNECVIAIKEILKENGIKYEPPLQDSGVYALRPISGAFHNEIYARGLGEIGEPRVHVLVCDPGVGGDREGIVVKTKANAVYVGPNNGVFWETIKREGIATDDGQPEVYKVRDEIFKAVKSATFHGREVFAPVGAEIASGKEPAKLSEWLEPFSPDELVQLDFEPNQILDVDGFNLVKINTKIPEDHPIGARVTITDRETGEQKVLEIPTAQQFVDMKKGDLLIYPGSSWGLVEIAASNAVHEHEPHAVKQLTVDYPNNPIEPGDKLSIEWIYA